MKIIKGIGTAFLAILLLILFIIVLPFGLIYNLFDYLFSKVKYKKSNFYKDLNVKFSFSLSNSIGYLIYDYVKENPNLEFITLGNTGFYLKNGNTIAVTFPYSGVTFKENEWLYTDENDENEFTDYNLLNAVKEDYSELVDHIDEYKVKLIANYDNFGSDELFELAKQDSLFIIVNNLEEFKTLQL